ncbi:MAG: hypothetical protein DMG89_10075 [Acidobacteria bacterium]|jgi:hypothetical protein|nr:MAG: hypothetical protein DMG89_10075 [Acidobacteriota bacterium]
MSDNAGGFEALRSKLQLGQDSRLTLNRQEMILLPRHFFRYILRDVNAVSGSEAFRKIFWKAGHDGAETFCRRFQEVHRCTARQAVEGYLNEMSLRGWGQFAILRFEPEAGLMEVALRNSALPAEADLPSGNLIWEGAMCGAMTFVRESLGTVRYAPTATGEAVHNKEDAIPYYRIVVSCEPERKAIP